MKEKLRLFYSTCGEVSDSRVFAKQLLKNEKIICINIFKSVESFYSESKKIKSCDENILIIKTFLDKIKIEEILKNKHPYDIPFVIELKTENVNYEYFKWANKKT